MTGKPKYHTVRVSMKDHGDSSVVMYRVWEIMSHVTRCAVCQNLLSLVQMLFKPEDNPLRALEEELPFQQLAAIMPLQAGEDDDDDTKTTLDNVGKQLIGLVQRRTGIVVDDSTMQRAVEKMRKHGYYEHKFTNGTQSNILHEVLAIDNGLLPLICSYIFEHPVMVYTALFTDKRILDYARARMPLPSARDYKVSCSLVRQPRPPELSISHL